MLAIVWVTVLITGPDHNNRTCEWYVEELNVRWQQLKMFRAWARIVAPGVVPASIHRLYSGYRNGVNLSTLGFNARMYHGGSLEHPNSEGAGTDYKFGI